MDPAQVNLLIKEKALLAKDKIIDFRREFHMNPELGLDCFETSLIVARALLEAGLEVKTGIAGTGVVGILHGSQPGPVAALRVDMDALEVYEETDLPFSSRKPGVMHACGHDGHTAIGLGVAEVLGEFRELIPGTIKFIFQPGEEQPGGAKIMIAEKVLENPDVDAVFGLHIFPGLPSGQWGVRYGAMTAGNDDFTVTLKGSGGHGGHPDQTRDPIAAAGYLITAVQTIVSRNADPTDSLVITVSEIHGGKGHNVIPDTVVLKGTIRSTSAASRLLAHRRLNEILQGIKYGFDVDSELTIVEQDNPIICDFELTAFVEQTLREYIGDPGVVQISAPSMGADDFASFTEKVPGTYLRIGCYDPSKGYTHMLHTSRFDFDEEILVNAAAVLSNLLISYLAAGRKV